MATAVRSQADRVAKVLERSDLPPEERRKRAAAIKAQAHVNHPDTPTTVGAPALVWSDDDITIVVSWVEYDPDRNLVRVHLNASREGRALKLNTPYEYVNPPLAVHDPEGNVVEDHGAAFRAMVTQTVRSQA